MQGRCIICGAQGISDAYYCRECTLQEKDVSHHVTCVRADSLSRLDLLDDSSQYQLHDKKVSWMLQITTELNRISKKVRLHIKSFQNCN